MKELSIEEKAKRYDKAINTIRNLVKAGLIYEDAAIQVFSELKESEDEKIKRLLHTIANKMSQHLRDIFTEEEFQCFDAWSNAWLEKQGEQKPAWSEEDEQRVENLLAIIEGHGYPGEVAWLNDLKNRVQPQSTWKPSDEQMDALHDAAVYVDKSMFPYPKSILMKLYEQLKKLRKDKL